MIRNHFCLTRQLNEWMENTRFLDRYLWLNKNNYIQIVIEINHSLRGDIWNAVNSI